MRRMQDSPQRDVCIGSEPSSESNVVRLDRCYAPACTAPGSRRWRDPGYGHPRLRGWALCLKRKQLLIRPSATFYGPRVWGEGGRVGLSVVALRGQRRCWECQRFSVDARILCPELHLPSSDLCVPNSALRRSSSELGVPSEALRLPSSALGIPSPALHHPSSDPGVPSPALPRPSSGLGISSSELHRSSSAPKRGQVRMALT